MKELSTPLAILDSCEHLDVKKDLSYLQKNYSLADISMAILFLKSYRGSSGTFNSYRREIERLIHWSALIARKSLKELRRDDFENFINFCLNPPKQWIGTSKPAKFLEIEGQRVPNKEWRPFIVTLSKAQRRKGEKLDLQDFEFTSSSLKELFAILGSFYNYLLQEEYAYLNPVALIRQKSKFIRKTQGKPKVRRLSDVQWQFVIKTAGNLAEKNADMHERTLFIMSILYSMYLRISELTASERWLPKMNDFFRDSEGHWWFVTVGKGNKERQIAVSEVTLSALKRWRRQLNLSPLPSPADNTPLLPKIKGKGPIKSINHIRNIVQYCFDQAIEALNQAHLEEEAEALNEATVHWLRHTGISDDVKIRPREHVRDDAGHSSGAITDKYIDIELKARHLSAQQKTMCKEENP